MFIKNEVAKVALERSNRFSIFFLCRVISSGLFLEQFYSWLPLFKILRPLFVKELAKYDKEVNEEILSYSGRQTDKLLHGVECPLVRKILLSQRINSVGWGPDEKSRFASFSLSVQVLMAMIKAEGEDFLETDVFKESFAWVVDRWAQDLYHLHGLSFKGAIFLQLLHTIKVRGVIDIQDLVDQSIITDTLEYIEKSQSTEGSWGFFFKDFENENLDEKLGTPLMSSVVCSNLLVSQGTFKNLYSEERYKKIIDRGMAYLINTQNPKGFWTADSLDNFLKTLGWGIKFLQLYTKQ